MRIGRGRIFANCVRNLKMFADTYEGESRTMKYKRKQILKDKERHCTEVTEDLASEPSSDRAVYLPDGLSECRDELFVLTSEIERLSRIRHEKYTRFFAFTVASNALTPLDPAIRPRAMIEFHKLSYVLPRFDRKTSDGIKISYGNQLLVAFEMIDGTWKMVEEIKVLCLHTLDCAFHDACGLSLCQVVKGAINDLGASYTNTVATRALCDIRDGKIANEIYMTFDSTLDYRTKGLVTVPWNPVTFPYFLLTARCIRFPTRTCVPEAKKYVRMIAGFKDAGLACADLKTCIGDDV